MKKIDNFSIILLLPIFFMFGFWVLFHIEYPIDPSLLPSHVEIFDIQSARLQLFYYVGLVSALAMLCLFLLFDPRHELVDRTKPLAVPIPILAVFALAPFLIGQYTNWFVIGFFSTPLILYLSTKLLGPINWANRTRNYPFIVFILIYFVVFLIVPFFSPLIFTSGAHLATVDSHYAGTVMPGFDFVCCAEKGNVERSNYGPSTFMLIAFAVEIGSMLGVKVSGLVYAVKLYQVIAILLIGFVVYSLNRKHFFLVFAAALCVTAPLNTLGDSVYFPNQSGVRYIPFLVGVALLAWEVRRERPRVHLLSVVSALILVSNPETGFAVFCGFSVYCVLMNYRSEDAVKTVLKTIVTIFAFAGPIFFVVSSLMVRNFYSSASADLLVFVELFASGYGGIVGKPSVFGAFAAFFAVAALVRGVLRARNGKITRIDAFQAGIGTMILTWLPYYINRMDERNLWFHGLLVLFLFAPRLDGSSLQILSRKVRFGGVYVWLAISLVGGQVFYSAERLLMDSQNLIRWRDWPCQTTLEESSGLCVPGRLGGKISDKLAYLRSITEKEDYLVISQLAGQVRLLGFNEGFPWYAPFAEVPRAADLAAIVDWIDVRGPRFVVADDPTSTISREVPARTRHFEKIVGSLKFYREYDVGSGWIIYERIAG